MRSRSLPIVLLIFTSLVATAARPLTLQDPTLPEGMVPLPASEAKHFQELLAGAQETRGLAALRPVPAVMLAEKALRARMTDLLRKQFSADELTAIEIGAKAFGLIPESMDLSRYLPELLTSQVAGFYDPEREYMALVRRRGEGEKGSAALAGSREDAVLVHELTHALQDQHFDLQKFLGVEPLSEAATARAALIEGDATLTMVSFLVQGKVEALAGFGDMLKSFLGDPEKLAGLATGGPGGADLAKAPPWIRDSMLFSYIQGFVFCLDARRVGGQKLLDYAFSVDPPRSSEQILHPEKWHTRRDDPILLHWPDLSGALPGWATAAQGELGEHSIQILLRQGSGSGDAVAAAAAGWGGDWFTVYQQSGKRVLAWWTEWDSEADAAEFLAAARALGAGWQVEAVSPRRITVLRGELSTRQRNAIRGALVAAKAELSANRSIDLASVGGAPPKAEPPKR
jgi:hypothetical protein